MYLKTKAENRRLEEGLERMKEKWKDDEGRGGDWNTGSRNGEHCDYLHESKNYNIFYLMHGGAGHAAPQNFPILLPLNCPLFYFEQQKNHTDTRQNVAYPCNPGNRSV